MVPQVLEATKLLSQGIFFNKGKKRISSKKKEQENIWVQLMNFTVLSKINSFSCNLCYSPMPLPPPKSGTQKDNFKQVTYNKIVSWL